MDRFLTGDDLHREERGMRTRQPQQQQAQIGKPLPNDGMGWSSVPNSGDVKEMQELMKQLPESGAPASLIGCDISSGGCSGGCGGGGFHFSAALNWDCWRKIGCACYNPCCFSLKPCALLAEFVGAAVLIWLISGVVLSESPVDTLRIAIARGFILWGLIAAFGPVSGAHFNPHLTLNALLLGRIHYISALLYILVQFGGVIVGAALLLPFFGSGSGLGTPVVGGGYSAGLAVLFEILGSAWFSVIILFSLDNSINAAAAIGVSYTALSIFGYPITGASFNFFRFLGPAILSWTWADWWVYLVGPLIGHLIGFAIYKFCCWLKCAGGPIKQC